jgi:plastocyanin
VFSVDVVDDGNQTPTQHFVKVFFSDGALQAEPPRLKISVNDTVSWSAVDRQVPPFRVSSVDDSPLQWDSASLETRAVFSHAFGVPGTYRWADANRGSVEGTVIVQDPQISSADDLRAYKRQLSSLRQVGRREGPAQDAIFTIDANSSEPASVSILTGQTVLWVVMNTEGVSIAEREAEGSLTTREARPERAGTR